MDRRPTRRTDPERAEILLVEGHPGDARLTRDALREGTIGNPLHGVTDGLEALAFLRGEGSYAEAALPQLVLLDLHLPRKNGREVLGQDEAALCASRDSRGDRHGLTGGGGRLRRAGGRRGRVSKPVDFRELVRIVHDVADLWIAVVPVRPEVPPPYPVLIH
jgi:two-component system, chemotaxis family, response regulator Rcp1